MPVGNETLSNLSQVFAQTKMFGLEKFQKKIKSTK